MRSFDEYFDRRLPLTHRLVRTLGALREYRGKEELYRQQMPLNTIHGNHAALKLTPGLVRQLHRDLFKYTDWRGGQWKSVVNRISQIRADGTHVVRFEPLAPHLVGEGMEILHAGLERAWREDEVDKLFLISGYVLDFLCIHPFRDGNGRMARLLTLLLLYRAGYEVGRFISLERIIEESKEAYYDSLYHSSQRWHQGKHSLVPWTEYFLGTLTAAYREFEKRVGVVSGARGAKTEAVLGAIESFHGDFTVAQIQQQCPTVGIDLIRRVLRGQRQSGSLECLGRGPTASWRRI